jgi:hypothetical protein
MTDQTAAVAPASAAGAVMPMPTPTAPSLIGPDGKLSVAALRAAYPMYSGLSDDQLLIGVHRKLYPDIPPGQFYNAVNYDTDRAKLDPTKDMGTGERFLAGMGKTPSDLIDTTKRVGNMVGIGDYDQAHAAEDQRLAQPLMATTAGKIGKITGDVMATAIPLAKGGQVLTRTLGNAGRFLGAAGVAGAPTATGIATATSAAAPYIAAAGTGAGMGAALSPDDMSGGAKVGAALGPLGEVGGRVAQGVIQGGKALVEPLWDAGRQRILRRTLDRFANDPQAVRAAAANPQVFVPGYTPTLAEATGDTGIAQLTRGAQTMPPVANELADANAQRVGAYKRSLDELAGNDGKRQMFDAAREVNAEQNYGKAYANGFPGMTPDLQAEFDALLKRPAIADAVPVARTIAANKGVSIDNPAGSVAGMHYVKKGLDNQIGKLAGDNQGELRSSVVDAKNAFIEALRKGSPDYGTAMAQYEADSVPLNQMAIGQRLRDTMFPPLGDFAPDLTRTRPAQYAQALRDSANTAKGATGLDSATIENTLTPAQLASAQNVARDAGRYTQAQEAAKIPGSPTAQYLGAQNVIAQALGPLGGAGLVDSAGGRALAGVLSMPFRATASKTEEMLARVLRDPAFAAQILATRDVAPVVARAAPAAQRAVVGANLDQNK